MEIELKFALKNPEEAVEKLNSLSKQIKEDYQKDTYFIPNHRNFIKQTPVSEWLRLREAKNKATLNYKKWHNEREKTVVCDEFETGILEVDDLKRILQHLDFRDIIIIEKFRRNWSYKNIIISIDKVSELGFFIELELNEDVESPEKAKEHLYKILKELNIEVGEQDFEGYPYLLLKKRNLL